MRKLMFTTLTLVTLMNSNVAHAEAVKAVETPTAMMDLERWKKLMTLIDSEIKTIKGNKYSGPDLKHRLFELYSEKIKLIKEKENLNLLKADPKTVISQGKDSFFKASKDQYKTAQSYALTIIAQYPKYNRISDIYYALAINSRDYGTAEETEVFLKKSIANSKEDSKTMFNAKTALAEYYYNNKRYHDAVSYYGDVLKNTEDEWYGKHLYNAGWCHLKERNFKRALDLIKISFETTKNKKYVSMREQVIAAIGIFYVQADATYDGIEFFEQNTNPSSTNLIGLAQSSMNKNNFSVTDDVLKAALRDTKKRKDPNSEMKVRLAQLDIYRESKKDELYFDTANNILDLYKKNKLDKDDVFTAQNKIKEVAGFMQINLIKDKTKDVAEYNKEDYKKIIRYFDILSVLDRQNKNQYRYYQGETALSAQDYHTALKYYVRSIMNSKMNKDKGEITKKSLEAMLSTLELAKLPKAKMDEYTVFAFKNYLLFYPQSEKSQAIYQKLFNKYFEAGKINKAVNVLLVYKYFYKGDEAIHREMLTQILDSYIKQKNTDKLAFWINKIEKGYLHFSADYVQNSIAVLGGLLFDKYQALEKKGQIKEAMQGYESIYDSKQYPKRTKAEAAYAIAALSVEQNKVKDSNKWLKRSLELYDDRDLIKITPSLLVMARGYRLLQNFELSTEVAALVSRKFCKDLFKNKDDFYELISENAVIHETNISNLIKYEDEFKKCDLGEKLIVRTQNENLERLIAADKLKDSVTYFKSISATAPAQRMMSKYLKYKYYQAPEKHQKDIEGLKDNSDLQLTTVLEQHGYVNEFIKKVKDMKFVFTSEEKFNEDKYNSELEQYFSMITELNTEAVTLSKNSSPEEVIMLRNVLAKPYFSLGKAVQNYIPQGVDNAYLQGFKQGMRQIIESLNAKGLQVDREKVAFLEKNNYFFEVQKNVMLDSDSETIEKKLNYHSAILFSSTLDITINNKIAKGQK
jgi:hypothetical protein